MKIGIIGLGLIGGSILKSLANKDYELYAVTRNQSTISAAKEYCKEISSSYEILKDCEIIFVAVPMSNVLETLDKIEGIVSQNTIVTDVSSLKSFVMNKKYSYNFIGSHPMAGTENVGFEHSFAELFDGAKWVLTPHKETSKEIINKLENIILQTGANIVYADAVEHDKAVAKISHMPMLLAQALYKSVENDSLALTLAASGFRDMTRLAMSNIDMACDMVELNKENIEMALNIVNNSVLDLKEDYRVKIAQIRENRSKMYDKNGKNIYSRRVSNDEK